MNRLPVWLCGHRAAGGGLLDCVLALNLRRHLSGCFMYRVSAVLLGLMVGSASLAQNQFIEHMKINPPYVGTNPIASSTLFSGTTYDLPGYGKVRVDWAAVAPGSPLPYFNPQNVITAENGSVLGYGWGADTKNININNTTMNTERYTVTFLFLEPTLPIATRLVLVVAGLHRDTTATVSIGGSSLGELDLPIGNVTTSPTVLTSGSVLKSGYVTGGSTNLANTGWYLFQPAQASTTLTVQFSHAGGDGIGVTLGYVKESSTPPTPVDPCCPPWNKDLLKDQMFYKGSGSISDPYTLKFQPSVAFNNLMQAYINYLNSSNSAIDKIVIDWRLHDQGTNTTPSAPYGPQIGSTAHTTWSSSGSGAVFDTLGFFTVPPPHMKVGTWYMVHTGIYLANNQKFFPDKCANNEILVRIQVEGGRTKGRPVLEFSDGKRVIKTVPIQ